MPLAIRKHRCRAGLAVLAVLLGTGYAGANPPTSVEEPTGLLAGIDLGWLTGDVSPPVAAGGDEPGPPPRARTWGIASMEAIPVGGKMAPNGHPYDPLFTLGLLFNVAVTEDRSLYLFSKARFWAQKPADGITNANQGWFDFSKRQFDLDAGLAWNFLGQLEARAFFYSFNNLNRGSFEEKPSGFKDGFAVECRRYLPTTNFDQGLYRYLALGYCPTKHLVGADGRRFSPGVYAAAHLALDVVPTRCYLFTDLDLITRRSAIPKLLLIDAGVAFRPLAAAEDVEFRLGADTTIDVQVEFTRTFLYTGVRLVW